MNNQKGFTLIELVVVIVILGILAAVAVPKFVDMQGEAKKGVLEGVRGSWKSAVMMAHAKYLAGGGSNETASATISVDGGTDNVDIVYGYPAATTSNLSTLVDLDQFTVDGTDDDDFDADESVDNDLTVTYGAYSFTYTEPTAANTTPTTGPIEE
jgi:MSHA pilin protein MshA